MRPPCPSQGSMKRALPSETIAEGLPRLFYLSVMTSDAAIVERSKNELREKLSAYDATVQSPVQLNRTVPEEGKDDVHTFFIAVEDAVDEEAVRKIFMEMESEDGPLMELAPLLLGTLSHINTKKKTASTSMSNETRTPFSGSTMMTMSQPPMTNPAIVSSSVNPPVGGGGGGGAGGGGVSSSSGYAAAAAAAAAAASQTNTIAQAPQGPHVLATPVAQRPHSVYQMVGGGVPMAGGGMPMAGGQPVHPTVGGGAPYQYQSFVPVAGPPPVLHPYNYGNVQHYHPQMYPGGGYLPPSNYPPWGNYNRGP
uniref:Uncharacterized protein n=1 Tax=Vitrella brassicaformis TaxID=1169539 RepID=A0A7S1JLM9_9ALVE|mmetsp:Transcript_14489/g.34587  ORF Transcript_14489/g.34587 Transcript_14489/m.34587 type:complete len:309 (+) Transcript_14489:53-979(+)